MAPRYIKVRSSDGHTFVISREAAMVSGTWKRMLSSENYEESQTGELFFDERAEIVAKVVDYLFYHLRYQETEGQPETDYNVAPETAIELLVAADYLDV